MISLLLCAVLVFASSAYAFNPQYRISSSLKGQDFFRAFSFENIADPTHGRVNYVDAGTAAMRNLTFASDNHFIVRADFKKTLPSNGPGRDSVRLRSNKQYSTSLMIFNLRHMPQGCGTWPAIWTVGSNWPNNGEIDIVEGVNDQGVNQATLHTSSGCQMPSRSSQTGFSVSNNCDTFATNNAGCGVKFKDKSSYGPAFNQNGGGWFAMERTTSYIKLWFFPRTSNVPSDVLSGRTFVNPSNWGMPAAYFTNDQCPIQQKIGLHNIIINLTFCGDWAGSVYKQSGCPGSCVDYVNKNPQAFQNAYFDFVSLNIYEPAN